MSKKKINKIKTKQKQKQKQSQSVIVNIHKSTRTRKPTNNETPRKNVQQLPTPQYIYTSQTDNLVPQMFNKQGQQETLAEQINKTLDEKINKLVSQYTTNPTQPTQPTQQKIREIRSEQYNKPNIRKTISEYGKNKPFDRNKSFDRNKLFNDTSSKPKEKVYTNIFNDPSPIPPLGNIQIPITVVNEPILVKSEPETIQSIINKKPNNELQENKLSLEEYEEVMSRLKTEQEVEQINKDITDLVEQNEDYKNKIIIKEEEKKKASKGKKGPFTRSITNYNVQIKNNKKTINELKESLKNKNIKIILYIWQPKNSLKKLVEVYRMQ